MRQARTRSCSIRRDRAFPSVTTPDGNCATRCSPAPTRPRPNAWATSRSGPSTNAGASMRRWRRAPRTVSRWTPARSADGPFHELHGSSTAEPARRLGVPAVPYARRGPPPRGRWRRSGRSSFTVRRRAGRAGRTRRDAWRSRDGELRRVAHLFPLQGRRRIRSSPLSEPPRTGGRRRRGPGDRQPERDDTGWLDRLRPGARGRGCGRTRGQHLLEPHRPGRSRVERSSSVSSTSSSPSRRR